MFTRGFLGQQIVNTPSLKDAVAAEASTIPGRRRLRATNTLEQPPQCHTVGALVPASCCHSSLMLLLLLVLHVHSDLWLKLSVRTFSWTSTYTRRKHHVSNVSRSCCEIPKQEWARYITI